MVGVACWLYLVVAVSLWLLLVAQADQWWFATVILFGPRWTALLPLVILLPAALAVRRRSIWPMAAGALVVLFPVMGLCIPWRGAMSSAQAAGAPAIRIITCNAHRGLLDSGAFARLIEETHPDVVAMQEWTSKHLAAFANDRGWYVLRDDELCLVSRYPIRRLEDVAAAAWKAQRFAGAAVCYELATPHGPVPLINLHLASPHRQFDAVLARSGGADGAVEQNSFVRRVQAGAIGRVVGRSGGATIVLGDFNTPAESDIFDTCRGPLADAFGTAGVGFGYTYRSRWTAVRIDHVLSGGSWRPRRCWVGPDVGSPHRPLIAELEWVGGAAATDESARRD